MGLRHLLPGRSASELAAVDRLQRAFPGLTIADDNSDGPHLSADAAYNLLGGDTDPQRVRSIMDQVRSKRERRALLRRLNGDGPNGRRAA